MTVRTLTDGSPVPEDRSHTEINPATGMQRDYVVLSPEDLSKGFVKPVRTSYVHKCGRSTRMSTSIAETYARDPRFYSGTFCVSCHAHFPLNEFHWEPDGEPMDPDFQEAWAIEDTARRARAKSERRQFRITELRRELEQLEAEQP